MGEFLEDGLVDVMASTIESFPALTTDNVQGFVATPELPIADTSHWTLPELEALYAGSLVEIDRLNAVIEDLAYKASHR